MDYGYSTLIQEVRNTNSLIEEQTEKIELLNNNSVLIGGTLLFLILTCIAIYMFDSPFRSLKR